MVLDLGKGKKLRNEKSKELDNMLESGEEMHDIFHYSSVEVIEKLGELKDKGYIIMEEFQKKE